jgi:MFS family permease
LHVSSVRRLAALGALYLAQGIVFGFGTFVLLPTLAARGASIEAQTGIVALAGVPWVLKLAWAPLVDRLGRDGRRPHAFASTALVAVAVLLVALARADVDPSAVGSLAMLWLALNAALALSDVSADALAIDGVPERERGAAQGVMLGGHHIGAEALAGRWLGVVAAGQGLAVAIDLAAACTIVCALAPWLSPPSPLRARGEPSLGAVLRELALRPGAIVSVVLAATVLAADVVTGAVASEFVIDRLEWTPEEYATDLAPVLLVANLAAFALVAFAADRVGHARLAALGGAILGSSWIAFALAESSWSDRDVVIAFVVLWSFATAAFYVGVHAIAMARTDPRARASHFAILMALFNLPRVWAAPLAAPLLAGLGWTGLFVACGLFQLVFVGVARSILRRA